MRDELLDGVEDSLTHDQLVESINDGPRRIVVLEGAENLFLATVNGFRALAELGPLIDDTRKHVFWVLVMRGLSWNLLRASGKELAFLRRKYARSFERVIALVAERMHASQHSIARALSFFAEAVGNEVANGQVVRFPGFFVVAKISVDGPHVGRQHLSSR